MPKRLCTTAAERQITYKNRVREGKSGIAASMTVWLNEPIHQGAKRICIALPISTCDALKRLARHQKRTYAEVIYMLISKAHEETF